MDTYCLSSKAISQNNSNRGSKEQSALLEEANRKWLELDKGMRSNDYGLLVYTMNTFPEFFMDYRLPAYINSGFMRLASAFRTSNNHLRWHIANVFIDSKIHWPMVQNVGDICRMLVSIMHSNDQIARALTLIVIGTIAEASGDAIPLQRVLIESLDEYLKRGQMLLRRHDMHERNAAIRSCVKFCLSSSSFSDKVLEVMRARFDQNFEEHSEYPRLLSFMKLNAMKALEVYNLFEALITKESSDRFKMLCIHCLGICADRNCLIVPSMVKLYLQRMQTELSQSCILSFLQKLENILRNNQIVCDEDLLTDFLLSLSETTDSSVAVKSLRLVRCSLEKTLNDLDLPSDFYRALESLMFFGQVNVAVESCKVALFIVRHFANNADESLSDSLKISPQILQAALLRLLLSSQSCMDSSQYSKTSLKSLASLITEFCLCNELDSNKLSLNFCQWLASLDDNRSVILNSIGRTLYNNITNPGGSHKLILEITKCLKKCPNGSLRTKAVLCLYTEALVGFEKVDTDLINEVITSASLNNLYFYSRKAMKLGLFGCAKESLKRFLNLNLSFKYNVWLSSLLHGCNAEFSLKKLAVLSSEVDGCDAHIYDAWHNFERCERHLSLFEHGVSWIRQYFQMRSQLISLCFSLRCILSDCLNLKRDEQFFDSQLLLGDLFAALEEARVNVQSLMNAMFDADMESIDEVYRQSEFFNVIDHLINGFLPNIQSEYRDDVIKQFPILSSDETMNCCFEKRVTIALEFLHSNLLRPIPFPNFIFQRLQTTYLQVNFSPELAPSNRPIQIKNCEDFSILVEGFLSYDGCSPQLNSVQKVRIRVYTLPNNQIANLSSNNHCLKPLFEISASVNNEAYFSTNIVIKSDDFLDGTDVLNEKIEPSAAKIPKTNNRENCPVYAVAMAVDYEDDRWRRWTNPIEHITYVMKVGRTSRKY